MLKRVLVFAWIICFLGGNLYAEGSFPFAGEVTAAKVNIRAGENVNFETLCKLAQGNEVIVVDKSYDWYKIKLPVTAVCYISEKYLQVSSDNIGVAVGHRVNVRASASEKSSIIGQLQQGEKVKIKEHPAGWYQIEPIEGLYGWVLSKYITFKSSQIPAPVTEVEAPKTAVENPIVILGPKKEEPALFTAVGQIQDVGRVVSNKSIHHKLIVNEKTIYYLEGDKTLLDGVVGLTVKVEGALKEDLKKLSKYPVIDVVSVNSLL